MYSARSFLLASQDPRSIRKMTTYGASDPPSSSESSSSPSSIKSKGASESVGPAASDKASVGGAEDAMVALSGETLSYGLLFREHAASPSSSESTMIFRRFVDDTVRDQISGRLLVADFHRPASVFRDVVDLDLDLSASEICGEQRPAISHLEGLPLPLDQNLSRPTLAAFAFVVETIVSCRRRMESVLQTRSARVARFRYASRHSGSRVCDTNFPPNFGPGRPGQLPPSKNLGRMLLPTSYSRHLATSCLQQPWHLTLEKSMFSCVRASNCAIFSA
jgi:hypothetical protein